MSDKPWHADFPIPKSTPEQISIEDLHAMITKRAAEGSSSADESEFLVVDTRRTDFENGAIKGAINLPAHSFYPTLPSLVPVLTHYKRVIFHCNACTKGSRGDKVAGWFQDALDEKGITSTKAVILTGGIRGWLAKYGEDAEVTIKLPPAEAK